VEYQDVRFEREEWQQKKQGWLLAWQLRTGPAKLNSLGPDPHMIPE
jgi:hypothetical protein